MCCIYIVHKKNDRIWCNFGCLSDDLKLQHYISKGILWNVKQHKLHKKFNTQLIHKATQHVYVLLYILKGAYLLTMDYFDNLDNCKNNL